METRITVDETAMRYLDSLYRALTAQLQMLEAQALIVKARAYVEQGRYGEALELANQVLRLNEEAARAICMDEVRDLKLLGDELDEAELLDECVKAKLGRG